MGAHSAKHAVHAVQKHPHRVMLLHPKGLQQTVAAGIERSPIFSDSLSRFRQPWVQSVIDSGISTLDSLFICQKSPSRNVAAGSRLFYSHHSFLDAAGVSSHALCIFLCRWRVHFFFFLTPSEFVENRTYNYHQFVIVFLKKYNRCERPWQSLFQAFFLKDKNVS